MKIAKSLIRETHDQGYGFLDTYHYMLESANQGSKTSLQVHENGNVKYFLNRISGLDLRFSTIEKSHDC